MFHFNDGLHRLTVILVCCSAQIATSNYLLFVLSCPRITVVFSWMRSFLPFILSGYVKCSFDNNDLTNLMCLSPENQNGILPDRNGQTSRSQDHVNGRRGADAHSLSFTMFAHGWTIGLVDQTRCGKIVRCGLRMRFNILTNRSCDH